ncbi:MAG: nuclear transport factor 2 family protein [Xanthobacteraceae bacterium]
MDMLKRLQILREIEDLLIDYWNDVDTNWGKNAHEYYTEDGRFSTSIKTRVGQAAIKDFYASRENRGERIARHLINNNRITIHDKNKVSSIWVLSLFAADGVAVLPSKPAIMMADVHDEVVRGPDGRWRYASRIIKPLFRDDTPTTG